MVMALMANFNTTTLPVVRQDSNRPETPRVAVVNRKFARDVFGSMTNAIGGYYKMSDGTRIQVVGIVEDGKYTANIAEAPQPAMFFPILQSPSNEVWAVVRSDLAAQPLGAAIRATLKQLDAGLPSFIQTWDNEMNGALFASRMATISLGVLGAMGALLSSCWLSALPQD